MYANKGRIEVRKELYSFEKFMKLKTEADKLGGTIVLHFRISTSGGVNDENIHPFKVNDSLYFCHNGILDIDVPTTSKINDTQIFNNAFMKGLPKGFERDDTIMNLLEYSIGTRNKFVFLNSFGEFYILNESEGVWDNGLWFSNTTYLYSRTYTPKYYKTDWDTYDTVEDDFAECECCGNRTHENELHYSSDFNTYMCAICRKYVGEFN
jgi:predicted glutamine amidotransferase